MNTLQRQRTDIGPTLLITVCIDTHYRHISHTLYIGIDLISLWLATVKDLTLDEDNQCTGHYVPPGGHDTEPPVTVDFSDPAEIYMHIGGYLSVGLIKD